MKDRIQQIINNYGMTAGQFAEELGVNPANISHIISGRNNPSLDIVQKISDRFPNINIMWLLKGEGSMLRAEEQSQDIHKITNNLRQLSLDTHTLSEGDRQIKKVIIFFSDGTYQEIF